MNIIVIIKFMRISFEVSSVAATKLPSGWWPLKAKGGHFVLHDNDIHASH